jgi:hypothetical protein
VGVIVRGGSLYVAAIKQCKADGPRIKPFIRVRFAIKIGFETLFPSTTVCAHKNKQQRCDDRVFVRHDMFAEEVKRNAQLIVIPDEWKEKILAKIETWESEASLEKQAKIDALKSDLISLKAKIDRINGAFTEGALEVQEFKELKNPLVPLKADLEQQIVALERSKLNRLEPLRKLALGLIWQKRRFFGQLVKNDVILE